MSPESEVLEAEGELWNSKTFSAHRESDEVLYCFEDTKRALNFDPDAPVEVPSVALDFGLDEQYPKGAAELARELAVRLNPEDASGILYRHGELARYIKDKEARDGTGSADGTGSVGGSEGDDADGGVVAPSSPDPGDEAGTDLDVPSHRRDAAGEHPDGDS